MKKLLLAAALILASFTSQAFAANLTATFGDRNASNVYRMQSTDDGVITFAQDTGILYPYVASTTNVTLTAAQSGTTMIFTGTSDNTRFTLPTAAVGMVFQITASVAKQMQLTPQSTDTIKFASLGAGNGLVNSTKAVGDGIEVICWVANTWAIKNITGTWTNTGASP